MSKKPVNEIVLLVKPDPVLSTIAKGLRINGENIPVTNIQLNFHVNPVDDTVTVTIPLHHVNLLFQNMED
jgi:hypothetical protein